MLKMKLNLMGMKMNKSYLDLQLQLGQNFQRIRLKKCQATLQASPNQEEFAHGEITKPVYFGFDIETYRAVSTTQELEEMIRKGCVLHCVQFPNGIVDRNFKHLC